MGYKLLLLTTITSSLAAVNFGDTVAFQEAGSKSYVATAQGPFLVTSAQINDASSFKIGPSALKGQVNSGVNTIMLFNEASQRYLAVLTDKKSPINQTLIISPKTENIGLILVQDPSTGQVTFKFAATNMFLDSQWRFLESNLSKAKKFILTVIKEQK